MQKIQQSRVVRTLARMHHYHLARSHGSLVYIISHPRSFVSDARISVFHINRQRRQESMRCCEQLAEDAANYSEKLCHIPSQWLENFNHSGVQMEYIANGWWLDGKRVTGVMQGRKNRSCSYMRGIWIISVFILFDVSILCCFVGGSLSRRTTQILRFVWFAPRTTGKNKSIDEKKCLFTPSLCSSLQIATVSNKRVFFTIALSALRRTIPAMFHFTVWYRSFGYFHHTFLYIHKKLLFFWQRTIFSAIATVVRTFPSTAIFFINVHLSPYSTNHIPWKHFRRPSFLGIVFGHGREKW